jgi:hypothetical protein
MFAETAAACGPPEPLAARILPVRTSDGYEAATTAGSDTMDPYTILAEAISSKQQVVARYHDEERIFSPHALGTKRGVAHVLVYQYAGGSRTGLPPGGEWRCLNVEELSEIRLEPGAWRTAENVFNPQTCLDEVEVLADPLPPRTTTRAGDG